MLSYGLPIMLTRDHEIISELGTPARDHIKFPDVRGQQNVHSLESHSRKERVMVSIKSKIPETLATEKLGVNFPKQVEKVGYRVSTSDSTPNINKRCARPDFDSLRKPNRTGVRKSSKENIGPSHSFFPKTGGNLPTKNKSSIGLENYPVKSIRQNADGNRNKAPEEYVIKTAKKPYPSIQAEMENR